jgi:teichoic acid transport system permease protein
MATDSLKPVLARAPIAEYVSELWQRRSFIGTMPMNQLRATNMDTVLGNFWFLVNPALQTIVYYAIFGVLLDVNRGIDNYIGYLVVGVLGFNFVTASLMAAARCMQNNLTLMRSMYFPRAVIPISTMLSNLYTFVPALLIMILTVVLTGGGPTLRWLALPLVLLLAVANVMGFVFVVARVGKRLPDLHTLLPHLIRLLFYCSGVLFAPASFTSNRTVLWLFDVNPFYEILELFRWSIMARPVDPHIWYLAIGWSLVSLLFGAWFFWRDEISYGNA